MDVQSLLSALVQPAPQTDNDSVPAEDIDTTFSSDCIDLASASLGSRILSFSDEFFADASNLINPQPPIHRPGVYVPTGAWYDGWETRRHNPQPFDWVIISLGVASGLVRGVEIDTAFFDGNHAPEISVDGCFVTGEGADEKVLKEGFLGWSEVLGVRACGPSRRQAWKVEAGKIVTHVRLRMWPDGGIARFRVYGQAVPVWPLETVEVELSAAVMGGMAVKCSDQHFGRKDNLLLPGRGVDMGDGWETKRSRGKHVDWVIVKLGARGVVSRVMIDTMHFRGNFPKEAWVEGCDAEGEGVVEEEDTRWSSVSPLQAMGPDKEFEVRIGVGMEEGERTFTHVKLVIVPDGGVKRFRVFGRKA
ncbi:Allantoicase [Trapelia coarctata]|nr:Allantoicase [Trapelia coarctata]